MKPAWRQTSVSRTTPPFPILAKESYLIDTHCHLDMKDYRDDLDSVLQRSSDHGVAGIVTIGIDVASSRQATALAKRFSMVRASIGIHPHDAEKAGADDLKILAHLAADNREIIIGYGEIGLDYVKDYARHRIQRSLFKKQLGLARELGLPVIIHDREAHDDCLAIIREEGPFPCGGIMHCFSGDLEFARKVIDCNFHISIPGIVTFKNATDLHQVASYIPLDKMLIETDGPFLAPVPYRGKRNEPVYTLYTAEAIARLRQTTITEIARQTSANACALFDHDFISVHTGPAA